MKIARPRTASELWGGREEVRREKTSFLRLVVSKWSLDNGLQQGLWPEGHLWRCFGAGVWLSTLLITHGFDVAATSHPTAGDLFLFATCGVRTPIILRHLGGSRDSTCQLCPWEVCPTSSWRHSSFGYLSFFKSCTQKDVLFHSLPNPERFLIGSRWFFSPFVKVRDKHYGKSWEGTRNIEKKKMKKWKRKWWWYLHYC